MIGTNGLKTVKLEDLKRLLREVHRETLACPIDRIGLAMVGLLRLGDDIAVLGGLDVAGTKAVLISVIAERT
ncbi:MAG: hypothetical protein GWP91_00585 [Rhodobacterales bacterium]|nr:hypothetical protein [Rhodobacterales bacterium]